MTLDAGHTLGWLMTAAYGATLAAAPQVPLNDLQVLAVGVGAGIVGGIGSALIADGTLTVRVVVSRMLASGMASGAMVAAYVIYWVPEPRLLAVGLAAMSAGLIAWPVSQAVPRMVPSLLREGLKRWLGGDK
jgi:hypothetical protein